MRDRLRSYALPLLAALTAALAGPPAMAEGAQRPALWMLADADTTLYFFGTIHLAPADAPWRSPLIDAILPRADALVIEADVLSAEGAAAAQAAFMARALAPAATPLSSHLSAEDWSNLAPIAAAAGLSPAALDRLRPWAALSVLSQASMGRAVAGRHVSVEALVAAAIDGASADGPVPRRYLETADEQIALLASMPPSDAAAGLKALICAETPACAAAPPQKQQQDQPQDQHQDQPPAEAPPDLEALFAELYGAWAAGDLGALAPLIAEAGAGSAAEAALLAAMFDARNARWAAQFQQMLAEETGVLFIAVGAGHFVGDRSVLALLRDAGWAPLRLQ